MEMLRYVGSVLLDEPERLAYVLVALAGLSLVIAEFGWRGVAGTGGFVAALLVTHEVIARTPPE